MYFIVSIHDNLRIPDERVCVEGLCGIKPEIELLFSVPFPVCEDIGMNYIWLSRHVA